MTENTTQSAECLSHLTAELDTLIKKVISHLSQDGNFILVRIDELSRVVYAADLSNNVLVIKMLDIGNFRNMDFLSLKDKEDASDAYCMFAVATFVKSV